MDFFSKLPAFVSGGSDSSSADKTDAGDSHEHQQLDPTELFSSAKVVAGAAKSAFGGAADQVDKSAAAGAASDLLGAVSHYTNIEESSYGKYVEQAETYLGQYRTTGGSAAAAAPKTEEAAAKAEEAAAKAEEGGAAAASKTEEEVEKAEEGGTEKTRPADDDSGEAQSGGGGLGGYLNLAQNFLNK